MATTKKLPATGWVIKNQAGEYLWVTPEGAFDWTSQPKWALRMQRQQDAQMLSVADKNVGVIGAFYSIATDTIEEEGEAAALAVAKQYGREEKP